MTFIDKSIIAGITFVLFLLPWQTAYIIQMPVVGTIGGISITLFDMLMVLVVSVATIQEGIILSKKGVINQVRILGRVVRMPLVALGILTIVYVLCSVFWSGQHLIAFMGALRLLEAIILCSLLIRYRAYLTLFAVSIVSAAVIQSLFSIGQFIMQESPAYSWLGLAYHGSTQLGDAVIEIGDQRWLRSYGSFPHPNILAAFFSLALFMCAWLVQHITTKRTLWLLMGVWSSIVIGLFFTFSREVWIGTIIGFIVLIFYCRQLHWRGGGISPYILMGISSLVIIASLSIVYWEPLSGRVGVGGWQRLEKKSINERIASYGDGFSLVRASPLIGVGMHQSTFALLEQDKKMNTIRSQYEYQPPHNMLLLILSELGVIGMILFGLFQLSFIFFHIRYCSRHENVNIFVGIVVMMVVASMFDHFYWTLQSGLAMWWIAFAFLYSHDSLNILKS